MPLRSDFHLTKDGRIQVAAEMGKDLSEKGVRGTGPLIIMMSEEEQADARF